MRYINGVHTLNKVYQISSYTVFRDVNSRYGSNTYLVAFNAVYGDDMTVRWEDMDLNVQGISSVVGLLIRKGFKYSEIMDLEDIEEG